MTDYFSELNVVSWFSVIDPTKATIGVGLGLPEYSPGAADRNLLQEVMKKSEVQMIEDAMLHDKIKMTDFERTEQEISEQVTVQISVNLYMNLLWNNRKSYG